MLNLAIDRIIVGILVSLRVEFFIFGFPFFYHVEFPWTLDENFFHRLLFAHKFSCYLKLTSLVFFRCNKHSYSTVLACANLLISYASMTALKSRTLRNGL